MIIYMLILSTSSFSNIPMKLAISITSSQVNTFVVFPLLIKESILELGKTHLKNIVHSDYQRSKSTIR